jgi:DNA-binding NtrC family response regulator
MADILAVDDEKEWRELYAEGLAEFGHRVRTSGNGEDALRQIRQDPPDLIILDIRMAPSGRQTLSYIRRIWPYLPVVVSSQYGGYRYDPDFTKVAAFIDKSPNLAPLNEAIDRILGDPGVVQRTGWNA